jgi:hypothetical protein
VAGEWLRLTIERSAPTPATELACDDEPIAFESNRIEGRPADHLSLLVVNPVAPLPEGARCVLSWQTADDAGELRFEVAHARPPLAIDYDRRQRDHLTPFPDDAFLEPDETTPTGWRLELPALERALDVRLVLGALSSAVGHPDGFSPAGPIVVELPEAPDLVSLPMGLEDSVDPLATVGLFDVDPESPTFRQRLPFQLLMRSERDTGGRDCHLLIVEPGHPLRRGGTYGLVITRRALTASGRPLGPSTFLSEALAASETSPGAATERVRQRLAPVLDALGASTPPIQPDDIALVLRISIRSLDGVTDDLRSIRDQVAQIERADVTILDTQPDHIAGSPIAAIVQGRWRAPQWRAGNTLARDAEGHPRRTDPIDLPFLLVLPRAAFDGPVPIVWYQHGNPGRHEELVATARRGLAEAGFAVIGFTDVVNREISRHGNSDADIAAQVRAVFFALIGERRLPDWMALLTNAEQLAFRQVIEAMGDLDQLPLGDPDGRPEVDPSQLTYLGISNGATHGLAVLPFLPEVRAAALIVGAGGYASFLIHQSSDEIYETVAHIFPNLRRRDVYAGLVLLQLAYDHQDAINFARFLYREPLASTVDGGPPSVLLVAGVADPFVPIYVSRSAAWSLGIPAVEPTSAGPMLESVPAPLSNNLGEGVTAGYVEYVPAGIPGRAPSPGCEAIAHGHYCPQLSPFALQQRRVFLRTQVIANVSPRPRERVGDRQ